MGGSTSSAVDWQQYSQSNATRSQNFSQAFTNTSGADKDFDPKHIKVRESRNSAANPASTPVILGLDSTGSMSNIALAAKKNFGTLMSEIYQRLPISDPHIMAMFFDDVMVQDNGVLQVTQFEADMVILDQMSKLYWTGNGGGNGSESYHLPLHFALNKCECDAFTDGRKGFIFTFGDDGVPPPLTNRDLKRVYGQDFPDSEPQSYEDLLTRAEEHWHVFHVLPTQNTGKDGRIVDAWRNVLGERAILLDDIDKLAEVLVAIMQVVGGADAAAVAASFSDPGTSLVVASAVKDLAIRQDPGQGVVRV